MERVVKGRNIAVVLAAGTGSRMKADVPKQFLLLGDKPLIYYALHTMEQSKIIDECILVTGEDDMERMRRDIVEKYGFHKVTAILPGGSERCFSVANAMRWIEVITNDASDRRDLVFIHDGARPFVTEEILERTYQDALESGACVAAVPSKDTIKLADEEGFAKETPERKTVWCVQTPQVFDRELIVKAYRSFEEACKESADGNMRTRFGTEGRLVTDDASVVELFTEVKVKLTEGAYTNVKVTTPEDMAIAKVFFEEIFEKRG